MGNSRRTRSASKGRGPTAAAGGTTAVVGSLVVGLFSSLLPGMLVVHALETELLPDALEESRKRPGLTLASRGAFWPRQAWYLPYSYGVALLSLLAVGGLVGVDQIQLGRFVTAGTPVFSVIDVGNPWVDANPKESDFTYVAVGQPVELDVDAFPNHRFKGTVGSLSPGTGAQFAILIARTEESPEVPQACNTAFLVDIPLCTTEGIPDLSSPLRSPFSSRAPLRSSSL